MVNREFPVYLNPSLVSECISGYVAESAFRGSGIFASTGLAVFGTAFFILGSIAHEIVLIGMGIAPFILQICAMRGMIRAWSQFYMDTKFVMLFCRHTKFQRIFKWQKVLSVKEQSFQFPIGRNYVWVDYLVIAIGPYRDDYDFKSLVRWLNNQNVICIPKTEETVSFVEQFRQIEQSPK